ncbi:MAG: hypothetical protein LBS91_05245, partial [Clostridiales Family XIII bacterium]|nr:hypothetical protein [Clostridiales Family XIII bacterium]
FSADKAQNVAVLVVRRGFATQSGGKKTNQMSNLFLTASLAPSYHVCQACAVLAAMQATADGIPASV